ncbi:MAG: hypothetical protein DMD52_04960 [Gemmatimonadetes bacterium]|nr:MAG: hypothetical protein DMD52_04960 [Gemmatimonadota bacterium]
MTALVGLWLVLQGGGWVATPARPTVGDTVWLERQVVVPAGWRVRAGRLDPTERVEPLGEPSVRRAPGGWLVRYPIVAWTPGAHTLALPPIWELRPDGRADSVSGGVAGFLVQSVIPDSVLGPEPRGALAPVRLARYAVLPPAAALLVAGVSLALGLRWRRRTPRAEPAPRHVPLEPEVPDARWLAAGEPKAVAARAAFRLRVAVARAIPEARPALSTAECIAAVERARPHASLRELRELLEQLDRVAFASAHGTDVAALAQMARRFAQELER